MRLNIARLASNIRVKDKFELSDLTDIGLDPGKDVCDTIPLPARSSIDQALSKNDFMSNAGRSNGNTFRVIKKWDKTGRQYAVVDIDGVLFPHQIPTNGEVFFFADFRNNTITSHSGRINNWKKIHKAKHDSALAAWAGADPGLSPRPTVRWPPSS
ncbi:hypothetical protein BR93DRAFT_922060 [Coniochaeta sp. PMI_546]|nr:hypothetical protein BR93DRAFT_922060 [Coniochaeta sp. PMI_546]